MAGRYPEVSVAGMSSTLRKKVMMEDTSRMMTKECKNQPSHTSHPFMPIRRISSCRGRRKNMKQPIHQYSMKSVCKSCIPRACSVKTHPELLIRKREKNKRSVQLGFYPVVEFHSTFALVCCAYYCDTHIFVKECFQTCEKKIFIKL